MISGSGWGRGRSRRWLEALLWFVLVVAVAAATPAEAQQSGQARPSTQVARPLAIEATGSVANGHGRIVLTSPEMLGAEVRTSAGVLVVTFPRPVRVETQQLAQQLGLYVSAVRRDPDGLSLRFALNQRLTINSMEAGERLFIDLMPDTWRGPPPPLPREVVEELVRRAREAERRARILEAQRVARTFPPVVVRVGNHPTFTRFVFPLPEPVNVAMDRSSERLTLHIEKPFPGDVSQARRALPPFIPDIIAESSPDALTFRIELDPTLDVRGFREESTFVVDVTHRGAATATGQRLLGAPNAATEPGIILPGSSPVTPMLPRTPEQTARPAQATRPAPSADQPAPTVPPRAETAPSPVAGSAAMVAEPGPSRLASAAPAAPAPESQQPAAALAEVPMRSGGPARVQVRRAGDTVRILVPFDEQTPGAVFQRGDTLWLVFDAGQDLDVAALQSDETDLFSSIDVTRSRNGAAVRIGLDRARLASAERDGAAWIVTLAQTQLAPPRPVGLQRGIDGSSAIAFADLANAGTVHRLADPLAGDELLVVTARGPARSFIRTRNFVDFHALAGSHGLVFQPIADDLSVTIQSDRVVVRRPVGLTISEATAVAEVAPRTAPRNRLIGFDLELWAIDEKAPHREREAHLIAEAAAAHETQRSVARLSLARFYMARGYWHEAKGVIDAILRADWRLADDASLHGLRGIANIMMHRPQEALRDFAHPALAAAPETNLWRGVALAAVGREREAQEVLARAALPSHLPAPLARRVLAGMIDAALDSGDAPAAARRLGELEELGVPLAEEQAFNLLRGRLAEAEGHYHEASAAYGRAIEGADAVSRADAGQRLLALRQRTGQLETAAAIEILDAMRFSWRGDATEARTLAQLGRLRAEQGQYREAFETLRAALRLYPNDVAVRGLHDDIGRRFTELFIGGGTESMSPVEALALYYDFRDFTPQGRQGDDLIRRLSDRLIAVDLLDQAAALLQHQVDRRLTGAARAQVAARVALVHLMNRKPQLALQALRGTRVADLPNSLRQQRYLLEARALADSGRTEQALDLLKEVRAPEAEAMRADILWSAERYRESAEQTELWLSSRRADAPLTDIERGQILRAAIGYALTDEAMSLDRVRTNWRAAMERTPDAQSFDIVTAPIDARGVAYREIARSIADIDTLQAFLKAYRERYPTETPAAAGRPQAAVPTPPRG